MIKKLRYYARFIVVCLLLNNRDIVQKLMDELSGLVDDYIKIFKPVDSTEWQCVLHEIAGEIFGTPDIDTYGFACGESFGGANE